MERPYSYLYELSRAIKARRYQEAIKQLNILGLSQGGKEADVKNFLDQLAPKPRKKLSSENTVDGGYVVTSPSRIYREE